MTDNKSIAESRYAKLKEHVAAVLARVPEPSGSKPRISLIRNEFVGWARAVSIERKYRMIESLDNNRLKVSFCDHILVRNDDASLSIETKGHYALSGQSITRLVKDFVSMSTGMVLYLLKEECCALLAKDLIADENIIRRIFSSLNHKFKNQINSSPRNLPGSLKLLNNLPVAGEECALAKVLWDSNFFRREILSLTVKIFGFPGTVPQYNWVARNFELLKKLQAENPALCCLLSFPAGQSTRLGGLFDCKENCKDYLQYGPNAFQKLKSTCKALGLTEAGWKWLCKQGKWFFSDLRLDAYSAKFISDCAMKQLGKLPKISNLQFVIADHNSVLRESVVHMYLEQLATKKVRAASRHLLDLALDYAMETFDNNKPCKISWKNLQLQQDRWHRDLREQPDSTGNHQNLDWPAVLPTVKTKSHVAIELTSSIELRAEGREMGHCVGGNHYSVACADGRSAIYSIKTPDELRVATVELALYGGKFQVRQCYGPGNTPVRKAVRATANKLAILYTEQVSKKCSKPPMQLSA